MSIIHKGGMDPAEFAGRTMYRVMETKQMQKEAEYSVEDRVKERPAGPKLRDRVRSILQKITGKTALRKVLLPCFLHALVTIS